MTLPARDLLDVRLSAAFAAGGCPICGVRARSERGIIDSILSERVLDVPFREGLERREGFCRRHLRELIVADRAGSGTILGSSILYGAMLARRLDLIRGGIGTKGRTLRARLGLARVRPPCVACRQGASAVETAMARAVERTSDPEWAASLMKAAFCVDDFLALWAVAAGSAGFEPIARGQIARLTDLQRRLEGFADHSSYDRAHLMVDHERSAGDEAAQALGGSGDRS